MSNNFPNEADANGSGTISRGPLGHTGTSSSVTVTMTGGILRNTHHSITEGITELKMKTHRLYYLIKRSGCVL